MTANSSREPLGRAFETPAAKRRYVQRLFGVIADRYDVVTRVLSFGLDQGWKRRLVGLTGAGPGARVLDLACGTGDLTRLAAARGATALGLDFTPRMIERARLKSSSGDVRWLVGDMGALPVAPESFDVVTAGYGLRNAPELPTALGETYRALAPGGVFCALDFDRPEAPWLRAVYLAYLTVVGSVLGVILHGDPDTYRYIPASIRRYPGARGVAALMGAAGFRDVRHLAVFGGFMAIHVARK